MSPRLKKLARRLEYRCDYADDYVRCIRAIARTRDLDAIPILAALLDDRGPTARAAMSALVGFGEAAVPAMQRCVDESLDEDAIAHAGQVLERIERRAERAARCAA